MHCRRAVDCHVLPMDSPTYQLLDHDDMFRSHSYALLDMGITRLVERCPHRILSDILLGAGLAAAMWGVFWLGEFFSTLLFDFARPQVDTIYGMKEGENPLVLTLLMLFIIGPAEEIFWRGYIQKGLSKRWNPNWGFVVTTLVYSLVHLAKFNFMLIMAAAVAGLIWGLAYRFFPERLGAIIISHALWDCAVFIWFPIM